MVKASTLRRISQVFFFIILIYTPFIFVAQIDTIIFPFIEANPDVPRPEWYNPPTEYEQVFDTYGPVKTCRFIGGESRVFRACFLHFFSEGIVWATPLALMIPHILFFVFLAFLLGRFYCGWMCPLGFLQELMVIVRRRLGIPYKEIPERVRAFLATFRYAFVCFIIIMAIAVAIPALGLTFLQAEFSIIGCSTCPARIIFPLFSGNEPGYYSFSSPLYTIFAIIGITFLLMFFLSFIFNRLFCKVCPSGTILSVFNVGSMLSKEKDVKKCTRCGVCSRVCPMDNKNVYREKKNKKIDSANCIRCFSCIENCPEEGCLKVKFLGKSIMVSGKRLIHRLKKVKKA